MRAPLRDGEAIVTDVERKLALYRDERKFASWLGDYAQARPNLREERNIEQDDAALVQELRRPILERMQAGEAVRHAERQEAAVVLVAFGMYPGEHGLAYSTAALDVVTGA